jgi:hypothetical protein
MIQTRRARHRAQNKSISVYSKSRMRRRPWIDVGCSLPECTGYPKYGLYDERGESWAGGRLDRGAVFGC